MTENNNQTMSLEDITRALTELTKAVEAIRGGESTPELDPSDPLNETSESPWCATDANDSENERANNILSEWGAPHTIRNFLKALMSKEHSDSWYTVRSLASRKYYRISRVDEVSGITAPDGYAFMQSRAHDFTVPVTLEELTAGWVIDTTAKVLDVFKLDGTTYSIYEMFYD